jgi:hypothetical protein
MLCLHPGRRWQLLPLRSRTEEQLTQRYQTTEVAVDEDENDIGDKAIL